MTEELAETNEITPKIICDYTSYPREFVKYRWYRPIIVAATAFAFYTIMGVALLILVIIVGGGDYSSIQEIVDGGYDSFNAYSATGALITLGSTALFIPAIAVANFVAGGRTFKSYESSRGGWNYRIFFKCLFIALVLAAVPITIDNLFFIGRMSENQFTVLGFILCTILGPMQCIGEEFFFRGVIMQGFGSWFRIPILAIVLQAAVFASMHPYDAIGVTEIAISGICMGLVAWISRGIEASSAIHICNNMAIFYSVGFGYGYISTETSIHDFVLSVCIEVLYVAVIFICRKKGWFDEVKCDDAAEYNRQVGEKAMLKAYMKDLQHGNQTDSDQIP